MAFLGKASLYFLIATIRLKGGWRIEKGGILGKIGLQPFCNFRWEEG
jgi:hypothetical protein